MRRRINHGALRSSGSRDSGQTWRLRSAASSCATAAAQQRLLSRQPLIAYKRRREQIALPRRLISPELGWKDMNEEFDTVISLGARCQVAHQLRRKFPHLKSQFFDWLNTPDQALVEILNEGMKGFPDDLPLSLGPSHQHQFNHRHIIEGRFGTLLSHDFINDGSDIYDQWKSVKEKYKKTTSRFHETVERSDNILFVRMSFGLTGSLGYDTDSRANHDLAIDIKKAIVRTFPNLKFSLLLISHVREDETVDGNLTVSYLPEQIGETWEGKNEDWDMLLDRYKIVDAR